MPKVVPRPTDPNQNHCNAAAAAVVPPEQINNFVYDSPHDRLVIDFGDIKFDEDHRRKSTSATLPPRPLSQQSTASSSTSSSGLLKRYGSSIYNLEL